MLRKLIVRIDSLKAAAVPAFFTFQLAEGPCKGAIRHHELEQKPARKTTLRSAEFFLRNRYSEEKEKQEKLIAAASQLAKSLSAGMAGNCEKEGGHLNNLFLFDVSRLLLFCDAADQQEQLRTSLFLWIQSELESKRFWKGKNRGAAYETRDHPHMISLNALYHFMKCQDGIEQECPEFCYSLVERCADEVCRHVAFWSAGDRERLDHGQLSFALEPAISAVFPGGLPGTVGDVAIEIASKVALDSPVLQLAPYHQEERFFISPPPTEALTSLVDAGTHSIQSDTRIPKFVDTLTTLLDKQLSFLHAHLLKDQDVEGWARVIGHGWHPEGWPTLAVLEFLNSADAFCRDLLRSCLCYEYGLVLDPQPTNKIKLENYQDAAFGLHCRLKEGFCKTDNEWCSAVLFGPPGTGKTNLVRAVAENKGWAFLPIAPSDLAQDGPDKIIARARDLLGDLAYIRNTVILLDEFDPFILERGANAGASEAQWATLITNSMLPLLVDLRKDRRNIFFLATNYVDQLDEAARRPGRFDALLPVWPPTERQRRRLCESKFGELDEDFERFVVRSKWITFGELSGITEDDIVGFEGELEKSRDRWARQLDYAKPRVAPEEFD